MDHGCFADFFHEMTVGRAQYVRDLHIVKGFRYPNREETVHVEVQGHAIEFLYRNLGERGGYRGRNSRNRRTQIENYFRKMKSLESLILDQENSTVFEFDPLILGGSR